jgi:SAM-dependent methyltransferase
MIPLPRLLRRLRRPGEQMVAKSAAELPPEDVGRSKDPWFWSHYHDAARIVLDLLPRESIGSNCRIVDFGCGDGATALGVATGSDASVTGLDLYKTFVHLRDMSGQNLGIPDLPESLSFVQNELGQPLPLPDEFADAVYSWSVFEHVVNPREALAELHRITKPEGALLVQIEPLYYSPYGSHLRRLIDEPWGHLLHPEIEYLRMALEAPDRVSFKDQDTMYRRNAFEDVKRQLVAEYKSLNRITADELTSLVTRCGFEILACRKFRTEGVAPAEDLLRRFPLADLLTDQIVVLARRPSRHRGAPRV